MTVRFRFTAPHLAHQNKATNGAKRRTLQEGVRRSPSVGCGCMVDLQHGDLLEQRRGGVDVLRVVVQTLALHEQSGAVLIESGEDPAVRRGWLLVRLGHPVMAFHQAEVEREGLEALLAIEEDALQVDNRVELYELSINALRETMTAHPNSVLHLEHHAKETEGEHWWSSVRLPATSWRRAARLEDIEAMALSTEQRLRTTTSKGVEGLHAGSVYLHDSPDPHLMIHVAVELAERGMPMLGLFGLPHAETDLTKRLPTPQCYALLSPHGGYEVLSDRAALLAAVNAFQWGHERSIIVINGLDRLGNALGDAVMVDLFRAIGDGARFNDHTVLCSTDLELFETTIRHALLSESTPLATATLRSWLAEPDALWDHPILLAPDEEEEQWLEAQIQHQGAKLGALASAGEPYVEGGSVVVDDASRAEATAALSNVMADWTDEPPASSPNEPSSPLTSVGATPWRPETEDGVLTGRFITESPRFKAHEDEAWEAPKRARSRPAPKPTAPRPPTLRKAQRLQRRKKSPSLPGVGLGAAQKESKALATAPPRLPDWPSPRRPHDAYRKENIEAHEHRQAAAMQRQERIKTPRHARALRDNLASSPEVNPEALPSPKVSKTVQLPSTGSTEPLTSSLRPVESKAEQPARESSSLEQHVLDMDAVYQRWSTFEEQDGQDSTALYNEKGEVLKRYKGGKK